MSERDAMSWHERARSAYHEQQMQIAAEKREREEREREELRTAHLRDLLFGLRTVFDVTVEPTMTPDKNAAAVTRATGWSILATEKDARARIEDGLVVGNTDHAPRPGGRSLRIFVPCSVDGCPNLVAWGSSLTAWHAYVHDLASLGAILELANHHPVMCKPHLEDQRQAEWRAERDRVEAEDARRQEEWDAEQAALEDAVDEPDEPAAEPTPGPTPSTADGLHALLDELVDNRLAYWGLI